MAMSNTADDVLRTARSQIGYREGPNNANKYGAAYGMNNVAWCQQFVWWVFRQAGAGAQMPKTAVTRVAYPWYRKNRAVVSLANARPGDVVWFDYSTALKPVSHVGIVEKNLGGGRIQTIEGNTNEAGSRTGGGVWRKVRASNIVAIGRPNFAAAVKPAGAVPAAPAARSAGDADRPYPGHPIAKGSGQKDLVKWIQHRLNVAAKGRHSVLKDRSLDEDGEYGDDTLAVVTAFQKSHGLQGLGMVGPKTWPLLNAVH
jgi:CHAP domain/Putative peptidoglycan binding domain